MGQCLREAEKLKILLVLTGGTISTVVKEHTNVMGISGNSPHLILEKYREKMGRNKEEFPKFDVIEPIRMLSECSRPEYLEQIYYGILEKLGLGRNAIEVKEENSKRSKKLKDMIPYDGIIITHGSDTLSYTAAFLAVVFSWIEIPLVLTAADYPLSDSRSNGLKNFSDAIEFIRQKALSGVFVVWQNKVSDTHLIENANIFLASELLEADTYRDCFSSYSGRAFGEIKDGVCTIFQEMEKKAEKKDKGENFDRRNNNVYRKVLDLHIKNEVLFLRPYSGLRYDLIALEDTNIRAVVHYLYHSGTAYAEELKGNGDRKGENNCYNILAFAKYCKTLGIDVYFAGLKAGKQRLYETNDLLLKSELGTPLYQVSPEMAYMKVLVAYNQTIVPKDDFLTQ